jgi:hypothetical protein
VYPSPCTLRMLYALLHRRNLHPQMSGKMRIQPHASKLCASLIHDLLPTSGTGPPLRHFYWHLKTKTMLYFLPLTLLAAPNLFFPIHYFISRTLNLPSRRLTCHCQHLLLRLDQSPKQIRVPLPSLENPSRPPTFGQQTRRGPRMEKAQLVSRD